ncbi:cyclopropane-fatty-acyl-phospholipid synthase family protein [Streptomyces sp. NPDC001941]|uniref:cyclopropane-fatty-acyl-phospholipid synthase family protein n=1 Tax=Streptomyces sp. NPDC001941 TaxID=3154659 RepID=UPI003323749D
MTAAAHRLARIAAHWFPGPLPVRLRAWDGSEAGPAHAPLVVLRSPRALRRLAWQRGELGLAEAYIAGDLDVEGDLGDGLSRAWAAVREGGRLRPGPADLARAAADAVRLGALGPRPRTPAAPRARMTGALHSKTRDRAAISHHYDLSNAFYELLLDESMAYSCAYWTEPEGPGFTLADAQRAKAGLVCDKLALRPGARLLDIGCGWGSLTLHAAREYDAEVTAVTLSREQRDHVLERVRDEGLDKRVTVRLCHYRDIDGGDYDAVSAIEMGEHVGRDAYPHFARRLYELVRPRGRVLVQQMSRGSSEPGGGAFIETYIVPDMHMRPVGETVSLIEDGGLEVRSVEALREHYVTTIRAWERTLEARWQDFTDLVGEPTARVWRLYLAGSALAFAERRMGVDQILAVRTDKGGDARMPATPAGWYATGEAAGR